MAILYASQQPTILCVQFTSSAFALPCSKIIGELQHFAKFLSLFTISITFPIYMQMDFTSPKLFFHQTSYSPYSPNFSILEVFSVRYCITVKQTQVNTSFNTLIIIKCLPINHTVVAGQCLEIETLRAITDGIMVQVRKLKNANNFKLNKLTRKTAK